jgi:hypothetical protein
MDVTVTDPPIQRAKAEVARRSLAVRLLIAAVMLASGGIVALIVAEAMCRCLPVCTGLPLAYAGDSDLRHWEPDTPFVHSAGWRLEDPVRGSTNAQGFVAPTDFTDGGEPMVAFVGDSFIEAEMITPGRAYPEQAAEDLGHYRAFRFGMPRSGLAEYVALAAHAATRYHARAIVINIVDGDIAESVQSVATVPGMHYFDLAVDPAPLIRAPMTSAARTGFLKQSALLRYVAMNLHVDPTPRALANRLLGRAGSRNPRVDEATQRAVLAAFYAHLKQDVRVPPDRVLIVLDAERSFAHGVPPDEDARATRERIIATASAAGFPVLDLQPVLESEWAARHQPLDGFPIDQHWNERCHAVIAGPVAARLRALLMDSTH